MIGGANSFRPRQLGFAGLQEAKSSLGDSTAAETGGPGASLIAEKSQGAVEATPIGGGPSPIRQSLAK